jgi:hypothetical protein
MDLMEVGCVGVAGWNCLRLFLVAGVGISDVEPLGYSTRMLVSFLLFTTQI